MISFKNFSCLILLLLWITSCSCSKEEVLLSRTDLINMYMDFRRDELRALGKPQSEIDKINSMNILRDKDIEMDTVCDRLLNAPGFVKCFKIKARLVDFIGVEMDSERSAIALAKRINGYYLMNWAFDDVTGEPVLEDLAENVFHAKKVSEDE